MESTCKDISKRASKVSNVILHSFSSRDVDLYMKAFDVYVLPILEYCYLWSPTLIRDIKVLENVLRAFSRRVFYICGLKQMTYKDRLKFINRDCAAYGHLVLSLVMFYNICKKYVACLVLFRF